MTAIFHSLHFFIILILAMATYLWCTWAIRKRKYVCISPYIIFPKPKLQINQLSNYAYA